MFILKIALIIALEHMEPSWDTNEHLEEEEEEREKEADSLCAMWWVVIVIWFLWPSVNLFNLLHSIRATSYKQMGRPHHCEPIWQDSKRPTVLLARVSMTMLGYAHTKKDKKFFRPTMLDKGSVLAIALDVADGAYDQTKLRFLCRSLTLDTIAKNCAADHVHHSCCLHCRVYLPRSQAHCSGP